jgi:hypothetical protein
VRTEVKDVMARVANLVTISLTPVRSELECTR